MDNDEFKSELRCRLREQGVLTTKSMLADAIEEVADEPGFGDGPARRVWHEVAAQLRKD